MKSDKNKAVVERQNRATVRSYATQYSPFFDCWAIVVGISKYKAVQPNLRYAHRDAQKLYELLLTPICGGFEPDRVIKLIDEDATTAKITRALRSFLKKPAKEDIVLLYFACHGGPDSDRPDNLYLFTHDTDPLDISGTALPMREINLSIQENLLAERVVILVDACHSGGLGQVGRRGFNDNAGAINLYLREASTATKGIAMLTSAEANEVSYEDEKWGGGHGVFTYYLLKGMRGAADNSPKDGRVRVGELFEYVRKNVKKATEGKQHPHIGEGAYDRTLIMTVTAGISAQEHYDLGCHLYQIGLKLNDFYSFESASHHFNEAIRYAKIGDIDLSQVYLKLGLALTASGSLDQAGISAFKKAIASDAFDAYYHLGIAYLKQGQVELAKDNLEASIENQPNSDRVNSVQELVSWLNAPIPHSRKNNCHALLIGINYSDVHDPHIKPMKGCVNDIEYLGDVLSRKYNFNVQLLADKDATYQNIANAFHELNQRTSSRDVVIIYYGGHSIKGNWLAADTIINEAGELLNIVSVEELYALIQSISASHIHLIMDTELDSEHFIERIKRTKISTLFSSVSLGQFPHEFKVSSTEKKHSVFTYILVENLWRSLEGISQKELFEQIRKEVNSKSPKQTPLFVGGLDQPFFLAKSELNQCPELFTFSHCRCYVPYSAPSLQKLRQNVCKRFTTFPDFHYSLGLAFLEHGDSANALDSLKTAAESRSLDDRHFQLGRAQIRNNLYSEAIQSFYKYSEQSNLDEEKRLLNAAISVIKERKTSTKYALIVGVNTYLNADVTESAFKFTSDIHINSTPVEDARNLKRVLIEKCKFPSENVEILIDETATSERIKAAFQTLIGRSRSHFVLFYFAGKGSIDKKDNPTVLAFDSRSSGIPDIRLAELSSFANQIETNLVSIIDASWTKRTKNNPRYIQMDENNYPTPRAAVLAPKDISREDKKIPVIGSVSLYPDSIRKKSDSNLSGIADLTASFLHFLSLQNPLETTYKKLFDFLTHKHSKGDQANISHIRHNLKELNTVVFSNHVLESRIKFLLSEVEKVPMNSTIRLLNRLIEERGDVAPEEYLNLGIIYYMLDKYEESITALQTSIDQFSEQESKQSIGPICSRNSYTYAHYWLGRVLHELNRDPARALSELRIATQQDPANIVAHYYLGQSLRSFIGQELLTEAEQSFQKYLDGGAPLGQHDGIRGFIQSRIALELT